MGENSVSGPAELHRYPSVYEKSSSSQQPVLNQPAKICLQYKFKLIDEKNERKRSTVL